MENMDNLESAKSIADEHFEICLKLNLTDRELYRYFTDLYRLFAS